MSAIKETVRTALLSSAGIAALRAIAPGTVTILMLHRFAAREEENRPQAHTPTELRALLQALRTRRAPIVSLGALAQQSGAHPDGAVAFTVDDGYADFAQIAWPVFREFDCPVTVFLTTGFLDRQLWPWWERVLWAFEHTRSSSITLRIAGETWSRDFKDLPRRAHAAELIEHLKRVPDAARETAITDLPGALRVDVPTELPPELAPMTWDDVRRAGREGATFGAHTVTHPILSRVDDVRAEAEIARSWERVRAETDAAIPVFCYPNGDRDSFGEREESLVAKHGLTMAVSAVPGNATREDFTTGARRRFRVPRFACPHDARHLMWLTSGWERIRPSSGEET